MTILPELFDLYPSILKWKIDLSIRTVSSSRIRSGISSIVLHRNEIPKGGNCVISPLTGIALHTIFYLNCSNWFDSDGEIVRYEYYGIN
jgi:hypothetical protein